MAHKFFVDTLVSKLVKNILANEAIPLYSEITDVKYLVKDCLYTYNNTIVKCTHSGYIQEDAVIEYVRHFDLQTAYQYTYKYKSDAYYHDSKTHRYLGEYLRYLRDWKNLDLMPFYNCFNYQTMEQLYLTDSAPHYVTESNLNYKLFSIPIKFGETYTIALDCPSKVRCMCVIHSDIGMVSKLNQTTITGDKVYFTEDKLIQTTYRMFESTNFNKPFLFRVGLDDLDGTADALTDTQKKALYDREKDLYLVIQVPVETVTSVTVLEGDYIPTHVVTDTKHVRKHPYIKNLSLLLLNTRESYAFSDRLYEYLTLNVINNDETISGNIKRVQKILEDIDPQYAYLLVTKKVHLGVWDDEIPKAIDRLTEKYIQKEYIPDLDGNINRDVERILKEEHSKYE